MTPKLQTKVFPLPKKRLLGRRKAVTIIAGFRCESGIVICSDTQETIQSAKRSVPKLRFEPTNKTEETEDCAANLAAAFCGAGSGPMIDKLIDEAWMAAKNKKTLDAACSAIEESIVNQYKRFGQVYQQGACPEVQLIYGVKMEGASRLFSAWGPIINEKLEFDSGGEGHYMADFIASKLHQPMLTINQCAILAAYVLYEAKEHVEGCGGDSQIAVLRNDGNSGTVSYFNERPLTRAIRTLDGSVGSMLMTFADAEMSKDQVISSVKWHLQTMAQTRWSFFRDLKNTGPRTGGDTLGIPVGDKKAARPKWIKVIPAECEWTDWLDHAEKELTEEDDDRQQSGSEPLKD